MSRFRPAWSRAAAALASLVVVGSNLPAARYVVSAWVAEVRYQNAHFIWPIIGGLAVLLSIPFFLLLQQVGPRGRRGRAAAVASLSGYAAAGAAIGTGLAGSTAAGALVPGWGAVAVALGLSVAAVIATADRRRSARAAASAAVNGNLRPGPATAARRRPWRRVGWILLALGAPLLAWVAGRNPAMAPRAPAAGTAWDDWAAVEPEGPLAQVVAEPAIGWFWVEGGEHWRRAVVLQPPFLARGQAAAGSQDVLRMFVALSGNPLAERGPPIRLRCAVREAGGKTVAEWRRTLASRDCETRRFGPWEALDLDLSAAAGDTVDVLLEAGVDRGREGPDAPLVAVAAAPPDWPRGLSRPAGPNCVVILVDALRADRLRCYGYPLDTSPRIDHLAGQGTLFEDVVSACSWTVPSLVSLFTGTYVSRHGLVQLRVGPRLPLVTLAEHFERAGVRTAAVSANVLISPRAGFGAGFEQFCVGTDWQQSKPRAVWATDRAIEFLRQFNGQRFFLYIHYMDPHEPCDPLPGWDTFGRANDGLYLGEIRYCDSQIGRLLDELEALGRQRDTLVVFLADHGEAFNEHGYYEHGYTVHREEVQVPLILRWPDVIPAGVRVGARVTAIDVHATIAELMGLPRLRHVEGESLLPLLRLDAPRPERTLFSECLEPLRPGTAPPQLAVYEGDHKLILWLVDGRRFLYNTRVDPDERSNRATDEPALAAAMERKIRAFMKQRAGVKKTPRALTAAERRLMETVGYLTPSNRPTTARSGAAPAPAPGQDRQKR